MRTTIGITTITMLISQNNNKQTSLITIKKPKSRMRVKNIKNDASVLAFVTDNIRKAFEIKEKAKTEVIIKGKNAEFVAKFVQKRNIFAKMYIQAKALSLFGNEL